MTHGLSLGITIALDLLAVVFSYWLAVRLLSTYTVLSLGIAYAPIFILVAVATRGVALWHFGVFPGSRRYAGIREPLNLSGAILCSTAVLFVGSHLSPVGPAVPAALLIFDASLCAGLPGAIHFSYGGLRVDAPNCTFNWDCRRRKPIKTPSSSCVVVGAFEATAETSADLWDWSAALNDPDQHNDDGKNQKQVDEPSQRIGSNKPQQPQHQQDNG